MTIDSAECVNSTQAPPPGNGREVPQNSLVNLLTRNNTVSSARLWTALGRGDGTFWRMVRVASVPFAPGDQVYPLRSIGQTRLVVQAENGVAVLSGQPYPQVIGHGQMSLIWLVRPKKPRCATLLLAALGCTNAPFPSSQRLRLVYTEFDACMMKPTFPRFCPAMLAWPSSRVL